MGKLAKILFLLVLCATLKAEKFEKIGTINIRGLSDLTPKLTQLIQNVDPKKKSFPVIAAAAITFNPEMRGFDLNGRIKIFYFRPTESKTAKPVWCMLVNRVSGIPLPEQVSIMGQTASTKAVDTRALVSNSNELLDSFSDAPTVPDTSSDLNIEFQTASLAKNMPEGLNTICAWLTDLMTNGEITTADTEKAQPYVDALKQLFAQTETVSLSLNLRNDRVELKMDMTPVKKSSFAEFISVQANNANSLPGLVSGKNISAAFNITPFPPAQPALTKLVADIEAGLNKQENKDYRLLVQNLLTNSNGKISYFLEENDQNQAVSYVRVYCDDTEATDNISKFLAENPRFPVLSNGLRQIYAGKGNGNVGCYATAKNKFATFVGGEIDTFKAKKLIDSVPEKIPDLDQYGLFCANANFNSRQYGYAEVNCAKTLVVKVTLFAAILKKLVPENIEKNQGK